MKKEQDVYLSGKTVRYILERFKDGKAIGLVGFKVKAFVVRKKTTPSLRGIWKAIDRPACKNI